MPIQQKHDEKLQKKKKKSQTFANQVQEKMSFIILRERERKKDYKIDEEIGPVN